jgi:nucleotide-binding universal stress UspA family protein
MYGRILIATDGSELATRAVEHGLKLAKALKASVTIVSVTEPVPAMAMADEAALTSFRDIEEAAAAASRAALDGAAAVAKKMRVQAKLLNPEGMSPAQGIVDAAAKEGSDLIVMASHGRSGLRRLMLGSQASDVLVSTSIPVLVLRFPETAGDTGTIVPMPLS